MIKDKWGLALVDQVSKKGIKGGSPFLLVSSKKYPEGYTLYIQL